LIVIAIWYDPKRGISTVTPEISEINKMMLLDPSKMYLLSKKKQNKFTHKQVRKIYRENKRMRRRKIRYCLLIVRMGLFLPEELHISKV